MGVTTRSDKVDINEVTAKLRRRIEMGGLMEVFRMDEGRAGVCRCIRKRFLW